jgi:hypothetical protein
VENGERTLTLGSGGHETERLLSGHARDGARDPAGGEHFDGVERSDFEGVWESWDGVLDEVAELGREKKKRAGGERHSVRAGTGFLRHPGDTTYGMAGSTRG